MLNAKEQGSKDHQINSILRDAMLFTFKDFANFSFLVKLEPYTTETHVKMLRDVVLLSIGINGKVTLNRSSELSQTKSNSLAVCKPTVKRLQS